MKPLNHLFWIGALTIILTAMGCASLISDPGFTTVHVSGPAGTGLTVDFWQQGEHRHVNAQVPWDFENQQHVSKMEIEKSNPGDVLTVEAHYHDGKCQTMLTRTLPPGTGGVSIVAQHGLTMKMISH